MVLRTCLISVKSTIFGRVFGKYGQLDIWSDQLRIYGLTKIRLVLEFDTFCSITVKTTCWPFKEILIETVTGVYRIPILMFKDRSRFLRILNENFACHSQKRMERYVHEFDRLMEGAYPREKQLERLTGLIKFSSEELTREKRRKRPFYSQEMLSDIERISSFNPVSKKKLRWFHEKTILSGRFAFFDSVDVFPLTIEQRLAVIRSERRNLVLAAAGTGKTSVLAAKAIDLIDRRLADPSEVLILAFNRSAADELRQRLQDGFDRCGIARQRMPDVLTFHALGRSILNELGRDTFLTKYAEDRDLFASWVTGWIIDYLRGTNIEEIMRFMKIFSNYINTDTHSEQIEYEKNRRDNEFRTIKGEKVRGFEEQEIANFLYLLGIKYEYEARYVSKARFDIGFDYSPDFKLTGTDIFIEHFGIGRDGSTRKDIDRNAYNLQIEQKRNLHRKHKTILIETYHFEFEEKIIFRDLIFKLQASGVEFYPRSEKEVIDALVKNQELMEEWSFALVDALAILGSENLGYREILSRLKSSNVWEYEYVARILCKLRSAYKNELKNKGEIDFDDMINESVSAIKTNKYHVSWNYVLVDEFQDISSQRIKLIEEILEANKNCSLTCVGDDWQSIYRFNGGDVRLTTELTAKNNDFLLTKLVKTFRYSQSVADISGRFVIKNKHQIEKHVVSSKSASLSGRIVIDIGDNVSGDERREFERLCQILNDIKREDPEGRISIIARYNQHLAVVRDRLRRLHIDEDVKFWTFHSAKGLETDYVIIIGLFRGVMGFPSFKRSPIIIDALLPRMDDFAFSEERRLFYIGLTRARKECRLVADMNSPSIFIEELMGDDFAGLISVKGDRNVGNDVYKCPVCNNGYLRLKHGSYGDFYQCGNGNACECRPIKVCPECGAPLIDHELERRCNNPGCQYSVPICEKCGRQMMERKSVHGIFLGCSGFGVKGDSCNNIRKI